MPKFFHFLYHLSQSLSKHKGVGFVCAHLLSHLIRIIWQCDIHPKANIHQSVWFCHSGFGIVINPRAKIGERTVIQHCVTIGERCSGGGCPTIGKNVFIGAKATILGDVNIGDNAKIGAHALVLTDVPEGATAVGVPAKIII